MKQQTAVRQMFQDLQEHFPEQMKEMYESNQLLLEDIALRAEEMEKQQAVEFGYDIADYLSCGVLSKKAIEDRYNEFLNSEEDESKTD